MSTTLKKMTTKWKQEECVTAWSIKELNPINDELNKHLFVLELKHTNSSKDIKNIIKHKVEHLNFSIWQTCEHISLSEPRLLSPQTLEDDAT